MRKKITSVLTSQYLIVSLLLLIAIIIGRSDLAVFWWKTTHTLPEQMIMVQGDSNLALEIGDYYFGENANGSAYDINRAEYFYIQALASDPEAYLGWHQLARIAFLKGEYDLALERINKQIEITEDSYMNVYYVRGLVKGFDEDFDGAIVDFQTFLTAYQNSWYTHNNIAWLYFQKGDFEKMKEAALVGLSSNSGSPWLLMNAGVASFNMSELEEAISYLEEAKENSKHLTPNDWSNIYPGNDPLIASQGLQEFKDILEQNITLVHNALGSTTENSL